MPEGDTVHLTAARLDRALGGRVLTRTDFRVPALATVDLSGRRVVDVRARGKHILFHIAGETTLHSHLRMDGDWHVYLVGARWRGPGRDVRAVLETDATTAVGFRLPVVELLGARAEEELLAHLGPDLLGTDWDPHEAVRRLRRDPHRSLGEALLDQRNLAGIGNVYKCEICFLAGISPFAPVGPVPDLDHVVDIAKRLVEANRTTGRQITTGDPRRGRQRWVYGRASEPCRRCGAPIRRSQDRAERVTYWCPRCQPDVA